MSRVIAIGDIHGCSKTFRRLLTEKINIQKSDDIYCIGDYIDRGTDSKGVVDFILELREKNFHIHTLRGNHEQMMLDSEKSIEDFILWMKNGGGITLNSFGIDSIKELDPVYLDFFQQTKYFIETREYLFVHAGLNFSLTDPFEDKEAMLWIRNFVVDSNKLHGKLLIHGHTPQLSEVIVSQAFRSSINIDGGCVYKHSGLGHLFALNLTEKKFISVKNIDQ